MKDKTKIIFLVLGIVSLIAFEIWGTSYLVGWRESFWTGIKALDVKQFWSDIIIFSIVAGLLTLESGYYSYLINLLSIKSRISRVKKILRNGYEQYESISNFKQRIETDTWEYYSLGYALLFGSIRAGVLLVVLLFLMVGMVDDGLTLFICAAYVVIATISSRVLAKPLIKLNYDLQTLATDFRDTLSLEKFNELNGVNYKWAFKTKIVNLFQALFSQASVIIPYIILSPAYFSGIMTFGVLMAAGSLIGQVVQDAGWVISMQDQINRWHSSRIRLNELEAVQ